MIQAFLSNTSDHLASIPPQQPSTICPPQEATGIAITANGSIQLTALEHQRPAIAISHSTCAS